MKRHFRSKVRRNPSVVVQTIADVACERLPATDGTAFLTGMAAQDLCVGIRVLDHWIETR